mgnify:CR=1 FL=1
MPTVYNKYKDFGKEGVYIGRGSPFGNPFVIGKDGDRDQVCDKYETYLLNNKSLVRKTKRLLKGKNLICFCKPCRCHGDTLLKVANQ